MSIFKDTKCAVCGEKTNLFTRTKLCDGHYLCAKHSCRIPSYMRESFEEKYTLEDYHEFLEYVKYSDEHLRTIFHETHSYYELHIDAENRILYIGYGITPNTLFLKFHNISRFDMAFKADKTQDGLLGTKVKGKVIYEIGSFNPDFYYSGILTYGETTKAKKSFLGNSIEFYPPEAMTDFMFYFNHAWERDLEDAEGSDEDCSSPSDAPELSELKQAMALFMIDSLDNISLDELKSLRNRLIKTFHPDKGDDDTKHAQKINAAYELIKQVIESK